MKDLNVILQRTLNEAEEKIKEEVVKLPMIERDMRIRAMKRRFGESKFKKFKPEDFMKSESEGFFFHYNPNAKKYYEGNASFQFMFFKIGNSRELSSPPKIDDYFNKFNFKVDHTRNTITAEKEWVDTKLRSAVIRNPGPWQKAIEIAIKRHPEIEDYKLTGINGVKSIDDIMEMPSEELIGKDEDFYVYYGDGAEDIRKALSKGMSGPFSASLAYSAALERAKVNAYDDPDGAWGIIKIKVNGKDDITKKSGGLQVAENIKAENIELVKASTADAFEKENNRTHYDRYPEIWIRHFDEVLITTKEDIEAMAETHQLSAKESSSKFKRTVLATATIDGYYILTTKLKKKILLLDQAVYNDRTVKDALGWTVFGWSRRWLMPGFDMGKRLEERVKEPKNESDFELIREWVFENNPPNEIMRQAVEKILENTSASNKAPVVRFLQATMPLANIKLPEEMK